MLNHWRLLLAIVFSVAAYGFVPRMGLPTTTHLLVAWNCGVALYLVLVWGLFLRRDEADLRRRASREDEGRRVILALVLCLMIASLVAIVMALVGARGHAQVERAMVASLAALTLVTSWLLLQSVFVLHYAHRHFGDDDKDGVENGGFTFPGEPARTYLDFVYLSFCIGATFQVSDTNVTTARLRNLITTHAATAYFYNTAILALGINIIASLVTG